MMSREELAAWLRLAEIPGVGPVGARRLLAAFGSPEAVFAATPPLWREVVGQETANLLAQPDSRCDALLEATWRWLQQAEDAPRNVVALGDPRYPSRLLQTADPPLLIYTEGRVELLQAAGLAIVGSRQATFQGLENAREFARALSRSGLTIVSGLALGVDGAAHIGALEGPGSTIAFVATGIDQVYPRRHVALAQRIARNGLIASDYALGTPPLPARFPRRNRLIAGQSLGTLVVEAALESGSLITARLALEAGREVFALPGPIHAPQSQGCHRLIREGAHLVESPADILQELGLAGPAPRVVASSRQPSLFASWPASGSDDGPASPRSGKETTLLKALGDDPVSFDALAARTGLPADQLAAQLLDLELQGAVRRLPGGLLQRCGFA